MKRIFLLFFCLTFTRSFGQTKPGTTFSGTTAKDPEVCAASAGNFVSEKQVEDMITDMLAKVGARNRYIIVNCTQVENCQAFLFKGKPYILYNPNFLGQVKKLNFSSASLPGATDKDWETLAILAHELGHHINNHLLNPLPNATQIDMELEADETAGFMIYLLGGTLAQAQLAYKNLQVNGSYTHPGRQKRLEAVAKGWNDATNRYPKTSTTNPAVNPATGKGNSVPAVSDNNYLAVSIGDQIWMSSNLNVSNFRNGDPIPEARTNLEWIEAAKNGTPAWCYNLNDPLKGEKFGKLYNWYAVNDARGLAPAGWHIPSDQEWTNLAGNLGGEDQAGSKMKSTTGWKGNLEISGESRFNALAGGIRYHYNGAFSDREGESGFWWSSSETDKNKSLQRFLSFNQKPLKRSNNYKGAGLSVRCVKD